MLNTSANVDAADWNKHTPVVYGVHRHLLEPIRLLTQADCSLRFFWHLRGSNCTTLLEYSIGDECKNWWYPETLVKSSEATVDYVISLLRERRQRLGNLVKTSLPPSSIGRLDMSSDKILDYKADLAVAMLEEIGIPVPQSLLSMEPLGRTVYHIPYLNLRHARLLWEAGFRDINALDSLGLSPLMHQASGLMLYLHDWHYDLRAASRSLELLGWFLSNGANLHSLQRYAFRKVDNKNNRRKDQQIQRTEMRSSVAALHYAGMLSGQWISLNINGDTIKLSRSRNNDSITLLLDILGDTTRDTCCCACSSGGCVALTMMVKYPRMYEADRYILLPRVRKMWLSYLQRLVEPCRVEEPQIKWLRLEVFRIITFDRFQLKHTCCSSERFWDKALGVYTSAIVELGDEEDREEIRQEQDERVEKLEALILEFEDKYQELGIPLGDFMDGYWRRRTREVMREQVAIDREQLSQIGVVMDEDGHASSDAFDESEWPSEEEDAYSDASDESEGISEEDG